MKTDFEIKDTVRTFLVENFFLNTRSITIEDDTSLMEKGIIDSTGILEVVEFIQTVFNIPISDDEIIPGNLDSLNNVACFVKKKIMAS